MLSFIATSLSPGCCLGRNVILITCVINLCSWSTVSSSCLFVCFCLFVCCDGSGFARSKKDSYSFGSAGITWSELILCGIASTVGNQVSWFILNSISGVALKSQTKKMTLLLVTDWIHFLFFGGCKRVSQQSKCCGGEHVKSKFLFSPVIDLVRLPRVCVNCQGKTVTVWIVIVTQSPLLEKRWKSKTGFVRCERWCPRWWSAKGIKHNPRHETWVHTDKLNWLLQMTVELVLKHVGFPHQPLTNIDPFPVLCSETQVSWENAVSLSCWCWFFCLFLVSLSFSVLSAVSSWVASCEASGKQSQNVTKNTNNKVKLNKNTLSEIKNTHECQPKRTPAKTWNHQAFVTHHPTTVPSLFAVNHQKVFDSVEFECLYSDHVSLCLFWQSIEL